MPTGMVPVGALTSRRRERCAKAANVEFRMALWGQPVQEEKNAGDFPTAGH